MAPNKPSNPPKTEKKPADPVKAAERATKGRERTRKELARVVGANLKLTSRVEKLARKRNGPAPNQRVWLIDELTKAHKRAMTALSTVHEAPAEEEIDVPAAA